MPTSLGDNAFWTPQTQKQKQIPDCYLVDCSDCEDPNCPHECHTRHEQVDFDMEDDSRQTELYGVDGWGRESAHEE